MQSPTRNALQNRLSTHIELIVAGASAGGLEPLLVILERLPAGFPLPLVVVMHLPSGNSGLAALLQHRVKMPVEEAQDKQPVCDGTLYVAGPDYHLSIEPDRSFSLADESPVNHARPAIDVLMSSAADAYDGRLAGILLSGASVDGAAGLSAIKRSGGVTIVQDPHEAGHATMPKAGAAIQPDWILRSDDIAALMLTLEKADED